MQEIELTFRSEQMLRKGWNKTSTTSYLYLYNRIAEVIYDRGYKYDNWFITLFNSLYSV